MNKFLFLGAPLLAVALMGLGCNPFASVQERIGERIGEKVVEGMIEGSAGGNVDVGVNKLPSDFPSDLPSYPGGKIVFATVVKGGTKATLSQTVEGEPDAVFDWYDSTLKAKGYTTEGSGSVGFNFRKYVKGDASIIITVFSQPADDGKTYASITAVYELK